MEQFTKLWISNLVENLKTEEHFKILEACGRNCSKASGMLSEIEKSRPNLVRSNKELYEVLIESPFKEHRLKLQSDHVSLTYAFDNCVCPIMTGAEIKDPFACQCTLGFLRNCLELYTEKELELELVDSYIKNDLPCRFKINLK